MRRRSRKSFSRALRIAAAMALVAATGCVSRVHVPYGGLADDRTLAVRRATFEAAEMSSPGSVRMEPAGRQGPHDLYSVVTPSAGCNGQDEDLVTATLYRSTAPGRQRLVIVLPIWGKSEYPTNQAVRWLTRRPGSEKGHVLEIHGERLVLDWEGLAAAPTEERFFALLARSVGCFGDIVTDVRRLLTWAERLDGVDPGRIGIVGFSLGAVVASLAMGQDDRLAAGVLVMGGADLQGTFSSCRGRARRVREAVSHRFGWTPEEFRRNITAPLAPMNPTRFAANIHPGRVLVIDAAYDRCMPEPGRTALWEALGRPERITLSYGHRMAFLSMSPIGLRYTTRRMADFLDRRLSAETALEPRGPSPAVSSSR